MFGDGCIVGAGVQLVSEIMGDKMIVFCGALSKPVTCKLGLLATEEALENHTMMRTTMAGLIQE